MWCFPFICERYLTTFGGRFSSVTGESAQQRIYCLQQFDLAKNLRRARATLVTSIRVRNINGAENMLYIARMVTLSGHGRKKKFRKLWSLATQREKLREQGVSHSMHT